MTDFNMDWPGLKLETQKLEIYLEKRRSVLTPTDETKLQTAHFTDLAPYWYISSILQFPQLTCATWFAAATWHLNTIISKHFKERKSNSYGDTNLYLPEQDWQCGNKNIARLSRRECTLVRCGSLHRRAAPFLCLFNYTEIRDQIYSKIQIFALI